jgi:hypothetical protein
MIALGFVGARYIVPSSIFFFLCTGAASLRPYMASLMKKPISAACFLDFDFN